MDPLPPRSRRSGASGNRPGRAFNQFFLVEVPEQRLGYRYQQAQPFIGPGCGAVGFHKNGSQDQVGHEAEVYLGVFQWSREGREKSPFGI